MGTFILLFHSVCTTSNYLVDLLADILISGTTRILPTENISLLDTYTMAQKLPNGTKETMATLTTPRGLRKCGIQHRRYDEADNLGALDYYSVEYVVTVGFLRSTHSQSF